MIPPALLSANVSIFPHVVKNGKTLRTLAAFTSSSPNRTASSTHRFFSTGEVPFYGAPRPAATHTGTGSDSWKKRLSLTLQNAATAFSDPTRADAVAAVGELTGLVALQQMRDAMMRDPVGRQILAERPVVSKETIPFETLMAEAAVRKLAAEQEPTDGSDTTTANNSDAPPITFGQAYGSFLSQHGFDPDERDAVLYIQDPELAYVMLRYRQCHDFWHALTALPPTVTGELGLKWLELFQTGLPLAALSSTVGSLGLSYHQQHVLWNIYLPWARESGKRLPYCALMNVYYEKELDTPLHELRERLQLEPAPQNVEGQH
jgi:ubiquinone biosynthesis protein COQ4